MQVVKDCKSITFLNHESAEIRLTKESGPRTTFKIFGSPYSPARGRWAFGYSPEQASGLWDNIQLDTDIVVTHTPPKYHCDESKDRGAAGCEFLRQALWRIRPSLAICGHVHEGRGAERVLWDLESSNIKYKESNTEYWLDPGLDNKKQCLIDLTSKGGRGIENTGSSNMIGSLIDLDDQTRTSKVKSDLRWKRSSTAHSTSRNPDVSAEIQSALTSDSEHVSSAIRGQGGIPPSGRCDMEALSGRMARRETCVINAAMMASSWPHKANNLKKYNKPIVVDIDLPTWEN